MSSLVQEFLEKVDEYNQSNASKVIVETIGESIFFKYWYNYLFFEGADAYLSTRDYKNQPKTKKELMKGFKTTISHVMKVLDFFESFTEQNLKEKIKAVWGDEHIEDYDKPGTARYLAEMYRKTALEYVFKRELYSLIK